MSRCEHIRNCANCGKEFRHGDCITLYCFDCDPAKAADRAMLATPRRPGESYEAWVRRVCEAGTAAERAGSLGVERSTLSVGRSGARKGAR